MCDKRKKKKTRSVKDQLRPVSTAPSTPESLGIAKGDIVLIFSPNSLRFPACFLAVLSLGAIATTANPLYTIAELSKQAKDRRPKLIITVPQLWPKVAPLGLPAVILGPKDTPLSPSTHLPITYSELITAHASSDFTPPPIRQTDVAGLLYSFGTTGVSKGVILTHRNFIYAALMVTADQELRNEPLNTFLCFLPMFHIFGLALISYGLSASRLLTPSTAASPPSSTSMAASTNHSPMAAPLPGSPPAIATPAQNGAMPPTTIPTSSIRATSGTMTTPSVSLAPTSSPASSVPTSSETPTSRAPSASPAVTRSTATSSSLTGASPPTAPST